MTAPPPAVAPPPPVNVTPIQLAPANPPPAWSYSGPIVTKLHACANCRRSKVSCSRQFDNGPCTRCVRLGLVCGDTNEVKLACLSCRRSKVKCNVTPTSKCSRCIRLGIPCLLGASARTAAPAINACPAAGAAPGADPSVSPLDLLSAAASQPARPGKRPLPVEAPAIPEATAQVVEYLSAPPPPAGSSEGGSSLPPPADGGGVTSQFMSAEEVATITKEEGEPSLTPPAPDRLRSDLSYTPHQPLLDSSG